MEISVKQTIFSLDSKNKKCNDCGEPDVKFVSVNNGITLCELCAQIHQNFGYQISYLRSIEENFDDYLMNYFIYGGNKKFRKTLKNMGVNLNDKKAHLYRTFGADYYRRNLKSIVKGNSQLEKDFNNPNEVMQIESNAFPEFENYVVNDYNKNQKNLSLFNNLSINLNINSNNINNNINNSINNETNANNNNLNNIQDNKNKSIKNIEEKKEGENENMDIKKVMDYSIKNVKKFGNFMKTEGIKGFGLMKKYGEIIAKKSMPVIQGATKYVKDHVPVFNNKNGNTSNEDKKEENKEEDKKNEENKTEEKKEENDNKDENKDKEIIKKE